MLIELLRINDNVHFLIGIGNSSQLEPFIMKFYFTHLKYRGHMKNLVVYCLFKSKEAYTDSLNANFRLDDWVIVDRIVQNQLNTRAGIMFPKEVPVITSCIYIYFLTNVERHDLKFLVSSYGMWASSRSTVTTCTGNNSQNFMIIYKNRNWIRSWKS